MKNKTKKTIKQTTVGHELTACQRDLLITILEQVQPLDIVGKPYTTNVEEIEKRTGGRWSLEQFAEATAILGSHAFRIRTDRTTCVFFMFQRVDYLDHSDEIKIAFTKHGLYVMKSMKHNLQHLPYSEMILLE